MEVYRIEGRWQSRIVRSSILPLETRHLYSICEVIQQHPKVISSSTTTVTTIASIDPASRRLHSPLPSYAAKTGMLFSFSQLTPLTRKPSQGSHALPACAGRGRRLGMGTQTQGSAGAAPWATNISPLAGLGQNTQPF